jgi:hypothetical protein
MTTKTRLSGRVRINSPKAAKAHGKKGLIIDTVRQTGWGNPTLYLVRVDGVPNLITFGEDELVPLTKGRAS